MTRIADGQSGPLIHKRALRIIGVQNAFVGFDKAACRSVNNHYQPEDRYFQSANGSNVNVLVRKRHDANQPSIFLEDRAKLTRN